MLSLYITFTSFSLFVFTSLTVSEVWECDLTLTNFNTLRFPSITETHEVDEGVFVSSSGPGRTTFRHKPSLESFVLSL